MDTPDLNGLEVDVHVPTLNEETYIENGLGSVLEQNLVQTGEAGVKVLDSQSTDSTAEIAESMGVEVFGVQRGKLTARDRGMELTDADIVVSADADCVYRQGWLNELLTGFRDPEAVMVHGAKEIDFPGMRQISKMYNMLNRLAQVSASNSAIRTEVYQEAGGFDLSVTQTNRREVWHEEEYFFPRRVARLGKVDFRPRAKCVEYPREYPVIGDDRYNEQRNEGIRF